MGRLPVYTTEEAAQRELVSIAMIRRHFGVSKSTFYRWTTAQGWPAPAALLRRRPGCVGRRMVLYRWVDVKTFVDMYALA